MLICDVNISAVLKFTVCLHVNIGSVIFRKMC